MKKKEGRKGKETKEYEKERTLKERENFVFT